jgi:methionyl-tRNA formyltransferase
MKMDAGLDTGDILLQSETAIDEEENAIDLMARLSFEGANLLSEALKDFDKLQPRPQDDAEASYAPVLVKEEGRINWESRAATIKNHVRGFQPFPTGVYRLSGKKITVWKAREAEDSSLEISNLKPGEILRAKGDDLILACGNETALKIIEIQIEGKKRMSARDFLNGVKLQIGERFV